jgi:hypothetical protein
MSECGNRGEYGPGEDRAIFARASLILSQVISDADFPETLSKSNLRSAIAEFQLVICRSAKLIQQCKTYTVVQDLYSSARL